MTTELEIRDAFTHLFDYCFKTVGEHITDQLKSKQTAYTLYMKEKHEELKGEIEDISIRSKTISSMWKDENKNIKDDYTKRALDFEPEKNALKKQKRKKGVYNNFQFFCMVERNNYVKKNKDDKKQSTRELSEIWKTVSPEQKEEYKKATEKYNNNKDLYEKLASQFEQKKSNKKQKTSLKKSEKSQK